MMTLLFSAALFLCVFAARRSDFDPHQWDVYKAAYNKFYHTPKEDDLRLETFLATKRHVHQHNDQFLRGQTSFTMAINEFADWFPEEIDRLNGLHTAHHPTAAHFFRRRPGAVIPEAINWVDKGAVTSVKSQGKCGSCYAFSAAGALEGLMFRKNKTAADLSAQQLLDCSDNAHCKGGEMSRCFGYVASNGGIQAEESYPYEGAYDVCRAEDGESVASCSGYKRIPEDDEEALMEAVGTVGPVSISFGVVRDFVLYSGGIFDGNCSTFANHGMLAVGYGREEEKGMEYWLVKNSWGSGWGEEGYARVKRNKNKCSIAWDASYPTYEE